MMIGGNLMVKRQSNFELLRILCMFFIIGIHILSQTKLGSLKPNDGISYYYVTFLGSAGRFVCNTFVMIGAWFLVDAEFKATRVINLWLEIFIYSVIITIICMFIGCEQANFTTLVQAFFPVFGRPVWFGAEYICLLLLTPWLNIMLRKENVTRTKKIVKLFGVLIIGCATLFPIEHTTPAFSELVWFCFLYLLIGLYKHGQIQNLGLFEKYSLICFLICYLLLCGLRIAADCTDMEFLLRLYVYYREHYEAFPGVICSIFLFLFFKNSNIKNSRFINFVSRSTFAVYIIHQTPAFYRYMWNGIFQVNLAVETGHAIWYSLVVILVIFVVCVCIDNVRIVTVDKVVFKSKIYSKLCGRLEDFYKK